MTRRERMEQRLERRQEWARGRESKASALVKQNEPFRGDIAFSTQPGHIPERARVIKRSARAAEHHEMAGRHRGVAATLERTLDRTVFSDDADAIKQLEARIAQREAEAERIKALNKAIRREFKKGEGWMDRISASEAERRAILRNAQVWGKPTFGTFVLTNLRGRITADRKRIEEIRRRSERTAEAEAAGGVVITRHGEYCSVTFAEKPERNVLDALRAAGFHWGGGSWSGHTNALPAEVS